MKTYEANFDGIVGPTHHYGGLSPGNIASQTHRLQTSYPKQAALEGLRKMKTLADRGIPQAVLPPHERPCVSYLREQGLTGSDAEILQQALTNRVDLLSIASSASAMWAANAATVSPSADCSDGKVHFTPANLISTPHRRLEPEFTTRLLRRIFRNESRFQIHDPLPDDSAFADEGAANHSRLCPSHGEPGLELFVYGRNGSVQKPRRYPARQTLSASRQIARHHGLAETQTMFVQQNPDAIDAGVFHNDVIAVANENVLFCHEQAFADQARFVNQLRDRFPELNLIQIAASELTVPEAVATYLFNSQLITLPNGSMLLLCPQECEQHPRVRPVLERVLESENPIAHVEFIDVRQSMQNGGGPACLRLRVVLTEEELAAVHQPVLLTDELYRQLTEWVQRHYREELTIESLGDPRLLEEVRAALEKLTGIFELGPVYPFQQ